MSINNVAAFQGWNSSVTSWNAGTWNTNVAYSVTATGSVGSVTTNNPVAVTGVAGTSAVGNTFETNVGVNATGSVGSTTVTGLANISVTGVAGTSALGSIFETQMGVAGTTAVGNTFETNVGIGATASVNSATAETSGTANIEVTGLSATASVASVGEFPIVWGQVLPSQTPNFSAISPSQTPSWIDIAA